MMFFRPFARSGMSAAALSCLSSLAVAQDPTPLGQQGTDDADVSVLPVVTVRAARNDAKTLTREEIDATPQGNRDLTSLIAANPALRLNPTTDGAGNRGSLAPESFSIHGESPYQNSFLIDGVGATNIISPQNNNLNLQVGNVPGFAQAYNIDTDLIDQVTVYDSMVPVEFGRFTGGVIDARIKTPAGSNTFGVKYRYNTSGMTEQRIGENVAEEWAAGEPGRSAEWKKYFFSANGDVRISERTAALLAASRRESRILREQKVMDESATVPNGRATSVDKRESSDLVDNLMAKVHTHWGSGTETSLLLKYADRREHLVSNFYADTAWTNRQKAMGVAADLVKPFRGGKLTVKVGYDEMDALRTSSSNEFITQRFVGNTYTQYTYGGFGTESLDQTQTTARVRVDLDENQIGALKNRLYAGLDLDQTRAEFNRPQDSYAYSRQLQSNGVTQVYTTATHYIAGTAAASVNTATAYLANEVLWRNVNATASVRVDQDDFLSNTNIAPRARLGWDVLGDRRTQVQAGWSRYYGLDLLGYALAEEKSKLQRNLRTGAYAAGSAHAFDGVETPFSDEWAAGLTQRLGDYLEGALSYVRRKSEKGVTRTGTSTAGYYYENEGKGRTKTVTVSLRSTRPWKALGATWSGQVDFSWQDTWRNYNTAEAYEGTTDEPDDVVEYNGRRILREDLPALQFNQPRRLTLSSRTNWAAWGLTWGNRVKWNSPKDAVVYVGITGGVERYAARTLPSYWTWNTSLTYAPRFFKGVSFNVEVLNVLNKIATVAITNPNSATNANAYETGREVWVTAAYAF